MHQSNLTGDRLGYQVMDGVLSAYRSAFGADAPVVNLPMSGDGVVLRDQQLWATAVREGLDGARDIFRLSGRGRPRAAERTCPSGTCL